MRTPLLCRLVAGLGIGVVCVTLAGCAGGGGASAGPTEGKSATINSWLASHRGDSLPGVYRVEPPDVLEFASPRLKELDGSKVTVRSDGKISLNLIGEVDVADKTPAEIGEIVRQKFQKFYSRGTFEVSVRVAEFKSKTFYVIGQVLDPGVKPYSGNNTVLSVLADAKLNEKAWPQKIIIIRANTDPNVKQKATVNLKEMYEKGDLRENFLVEEGDLVFIPLSPLAQMGATFQKVIYPIIPATNIASLVLRGGI